MEQGHSAKLPKDLLDTASAAGSGNEQISQRQCLQSLQRTVDDFPSTPSCPYNSLHDKHLKGYFKRSNVREFLQKVGLVAEDGTVLQTKEEERLATKVYHLLAERELILRKLEQKERERLERLHKLAAKTNIEISADSLLLEKQANSIQETQRKLMLLRAQDACSVQEMAPNDTSLSSGFKEKSVDEDTTSKQFAAESSLPFDYGSSCEGNSGMSSTCGSQSEAVMDPSTLEVRMRVLQAIEEENEQLKRAYHEQMLRQEEESLNIRLQYEKKRQSRAEKKLQQLEVLQAQKKVEEENTLEEEKMRLHQEIKRRIALETILKAVQEEERKAIVVARIKVEKQKIFELKQKRQTALCKAKIAANEQRKDCGRAYEQALVLSCVTSPKSQPSQYNSGDRTGTSTSKHPRPPNSNVDGASITPPQSSQEKKPVGPSPRSVSEFVCLPGQVDLDIAEEPPSKTSMVNKETNTSLHLLNDMAHLFAKRTSSVQTAVKEKCGVDTGPVSTSSTASQTIPDGSDGTVPGREPVEEVCEEVFVEDRDYLEAVEEVQNSINQELLESAIKMSPQISEAVVEKVATLGPEALEVLEEIKSKLSSSVSQTANQPQSPTPTPTPTPSHKSVDPTDPFLTQSVSVRRSIPVNPTLESIAEDWILISDDDLEMGYGDLEGVIETQYPKGPPKPVSSVSSTMAEQVIDAIFNEVVENPGLPFQIDKGWTSAVPPQLHQLSTDGCVDNPSISSVHTTMCTIPAYRPTTRHSSRRSSSSHNLPPELKQSISQETVSGMLTTSKSSIAMPSSVSDGPTGLVEAIQSKTVDSAELSNLSSGKEQSSYSQKTSPPDNISCSPMSVGGKPSVQTSTVSVGTKPSVQSSTVSVGRKPSVQTSTVSVGRKPSVQTSTVPVGHKSSVQSSMVSVGREPSVQTSREPVGPKPSVQSNTGSVGHKPSVQTSTVSVERKPSVQSSTVSVRCKPSVQTSTVLVGRKPSVQTSTVSVGRKPSVQTSTVSVGRKPSVQTSTMSVGPKPSVQTSTVSVGRKPSVQTSTVSVGRKPSVQTSTVSVGRKPSVQTSTVSVGRKPSVQTSTMSIGHKPSVQSSLVSVECKQSVQTSTVSVEGKPSVQTSTMSIGHKPSVQSSLVSVECKQSVQTSTVSVEGKPSVPANVYVDVEGSTVEPPTLIVVIDTPTEDVTMDAHNDPVSTDIPSGNVAVDEPTREVTEGTHTIDSSVNSVPVEQVTTNTFGEDTVEPTSIVAVKGNTLEEATVSGLVEETASVIGVIETDKVTLSDTTYVAPTETVTMETPTETVTMDTPSETVIIDKPMEKTTTMTQYEEGCMCSAPTAKDPVVDNVIRETDDCSEDPTTEICTTGPNIEEEDTSNKEAETDAPSIEAVIDTPTDEAETDTPNTEPDVDTPTKEAETDTPSNEPGVDTPTKEADMDMASNEPDVDTPTKKAEMDTPSDEPDVDTPTKEGEMDTPSKEPGVENPTKEAETDTPSNEPDVDTPTNKAEMDTPSNEPDVDTPTNEAETDTPSNEPDVDTPTNEAETDTPSNEPDVNNPTKVDTDTPTEEVDTDAPGKETDTDAPTEDADTDTLSTKADTDIHTKEVDTDTPNKEVDMDTPVEDADTDMPSKVKDSDTPSKEAEQGTPDEADIDEAPVLPEVSADPKDIGCEKTVHSTNPEFSQLLQIESELSICN